MQTPAMQDFAGSWKELSHCACDVECVILSAWVVRSSILRRWLKVKTSICSSDDIVCTITEWNSLLFVRFCKKYWQHKASYTTFLEC